MKKHSQWKTQLRGPRKHRQSGVLLVAVLACIAVVVALTMSALQTSLNQRHRLSRALQLQQTRIMLDAAARSEAMKKWRRVQRDVAKPTPFELSIDWPTGQQATIKTSTSAPETKRQSTLTATIGDPARPTTLTRRSRMIEQ